MGPQGCGPPFSMEQIMQEWLIVGGLLLIYCSGLYVAGLPRHD